MNSEVSPGPQLQRLDVVLKACFYSHRGPIPPSDPENPRPKTEDPTTYSNYSKTVKQKTESATDPDGRTVNLKPEQTTPDPGFLNAHSRFRV